ncbi:MAG: helix-turn-helix domain-containing protein [Pseudomonadota bacterium]
MQVTAVVSKPDYTLPSHFNLPALCSIHHRRRRAALISTRVFIDHIVAYSFDVSKAMLGASQRGPAPVALARQVGMYLAHVECGLTLTQVGHLYARDRTTVAHACALIEDRRDCAALDYQLELLGAAVAYHHRCALSAVEAQACATGNDEEGAA